MYSIANKVLEDGLRVISSKSEIEGLNRNEQMVHLAFRASNKDLFNLLQNYSRIRAIRVSGSYRKTRSNAGETFLVMQGIEIIDGDVWAIERTPMSTNGLDNNEMAGTISREARLSPELVKYVIKQSS